MAQVVANRVKDMCDLMPTASALGREVEYFFTHTDEKNSITCAEINLKLAVQLKVLCMKFDMTLHQDKTTVFTTLGDNACFSHTEYHILHSLTKSGTSLRQKPCITYWELMFKS